MPTQKAWMSPSGEITVVGDHHTAISLTGTTDPESAVRKGWTRLWHTQYPRTYERFLLAEGRLDKFEAYKVNMLEWSVYPENVDLDILLSDGRHISVKTTSVELADSSVESLVFRAPKAHQAEFTGSPPQKSIEGYYPSGTPIRFGDRRVKVRGHLRRRIVDHLEHPPGYCMCKRSKWVDRRRKNLIRRLRR